MKFDVCFDIFYANLPYYERVKRIAACGYDLVEFWFHDATPSDGTPGADQPKDAATLRQVCEACGVGVNNLVVNSPDGGYGGAPVDSADLNKYLDRLHEVIAFAKAINCSKGVTCSGNILPSLSQAQMRHNLEKAFGEAASIAEKEGFTLLVEPLNTNVDHAGYYLDSSSEAAEIIRVIDNPNLKLLYDIYHMQIMEGNIIRTIEKQIDIIGHFHAAGVPGRNELTKGELNYPEIIRAVQAAGYEHVFGLEYTPSIPDDQSLTEVRAMLDSAV
jgi:hydroxypyruvate isomerase